MKGFAMLGGDRFSLFVGIAQRDISSPVGEERAGVGVRDITREGE